MSAGEIEVMLLDIQSGDIPATDGPGYGRAAWIGGEISEGAHRICPRHLPRRRHDLGPSQQAISRRDLSLVPRKASLSKPLH